jgi:hypothetical protein
MILNHVTLRNIRAYIPRGIEEHNRAYVSQGNEKYKPLMFLREEYIYIYILKNTYFVCLTGGKASKIGIQNCSIHIYI